MHFQKPHTSQEEAGKYKSQVLRPIYAMRRSAVGTTDSAGPNLPQSALMAGS